MAGERNDPGAAKGTRHLFGHGRLSYIQIPAVDVQVSGRFYVSVFGWGIGGGDEAHLSFTDATGDMIGAWVNDRAVSSEPGVLPYIYVHGIDQVLERLVAAGGEIVAAPYPEGDLWVATFRDPAGNVMGFGSMGDGARDDPPVGVLQGRDCGDTGG